MNFEALHISQVSADIAFHIIPRLRAELQGEPEGFSLWDVYEPEDDDTVHIAADFFHKGKKMTFQAEWHIGKLPDAMEDFWFDEHDAVWGE